jgi:hypothetical protein
MHQSPINSALPEYEIFLRRQAEECWDTVYYATSSREAAFREVAGNNRSAPASLASLLLPCPYYVPGAICILNFPID